MVVIFYQIDLECFSENLFIPNYQITMLTSSAFKSDTVTTIMILFYFVCYLMRIFCVSPYTQEREN